MTTKRASPEGGQWVVVPCLHNLCHHIQRGAFVSARHRHALGHWHQWDHPGPGAPQPRETIPLAHPPAEGKRAHHQPEGQGARWERPAARWSAAQPLRRGSLTGERSGEARWVRPAPGARSLRRPHPAHAAARSRGGRTCATTKRRARGRRATPARAYGRGWGSHPNCRPAVAGPCVHQHVRLSSAAPMVEPDPRHAPPSAAGEGVAGTRPTSPTGARRARPRSPYSHAT